MQNSHIRTNLSFYFLSLFSLFSLLSPPLTSAAPPSRTQNQERPPPPTHAPSSSSSSSSSSNASAGTPYSLTTGLPASLTSRYLPSAGSRIARSITACAMPQHDSGESAMLAASSRGLTVCAPSTECCRGVARVRAGDEAELDQVDARDQGRRGPARELGRVVFELGREHSAALRLELGAPVDSRELRVVLGQGAHGDELGL